MLKKRCLGCGKEFEAKRSSAKYCSAKCRKLAFLSVPEENANENAKPIGITLENGKIEADIPDLETDLPDCVPSIIAKRYARGELDYVITIDRLLNHTIEELETKGVWIPCWRYNAGQEVLCPQ